MPNNNNEEANELKLKYFIEASKLVDELISKPTKIHKIKLIASKFRYKKKKLEEFNRNITKKKRNPIKIGYSIKIRLFSQRYSDEALKTINPRTAKKNLDT
jgi:hypothetical protein